MGRKCPTYRVRGRVVGWTVGGWEETFLCGGWGLGWCGSLSPALCFGGFEAGGAVGTQAGTWALEQVWGLSGGRKDASVRLNQNTKKGRRYPLMNSEKKPNQSTRASAPGEQRRVHQDPLITKPFPKQGNSQQTVHAHHTSRPTKHHEKKKEKKKEKKNP